MSKQCIICRNKSGGLSKRALKKETIFWERLSNCVNTQTHSVWKVLHGHLEKYHQMVKRRADAIEEVKTFDERNKQLKQLLNQYLSSRVNEELMVPPVQML